MVNHLDYLTETMIQIFCADSVRGVKTLPGLSISAPVKPSKSLGFVANHVKVFHPSSYCTPSFHWCPSHHSRPTLHFPIQQYYYLLVRQYPLHLFPAPVIQQMSLKISVSSSHRHKHSSTHFTQALNHGYEGLKRRTSVFLNLQRTKLSLM
jgi:hypothetical protein